MQPPPPTRGISAFVAINKLDLAAAVAMAATLNHLIGQLALR